MNDGSPAMNELISQQNQGETCSSCKHPIDGDCERCAECEALLCADCAEDGCFYCDAYAEGGEIKELEDEIDEIEDEIEELQSELSRKNRELEAAKKRLGVK